MTELKPCPFCGGKAHFRTTSNISNHTRVGFSCIISCLQCGCTPIRKSKEIFMFLDQDGKVQVDDVSKELMEDMICEWNRRADDDR